MLTLVASALPGGDCIDDTDMLRTSGTAGSIGCEVEAPSTLDNFLRSFRWGLVRQLDRVSRELRAWAAGAGPGDGPLTIDLDSTICEAHGPANEGGPRRRADGPAPRRPPTSCTRRCDGCATPGPRDNSHNQHLIPTRDSVDTKSLSGGAW